MSYAKGMNGSIGTRLRVDNVHYELTEADLRVSLLAAVVDGAIEILLTQDLGTL